MVAEIKKVMRLLLKQYPECRSEKLLWSARKKEEPFRALIGTVLSQRTRDENTRRAAESLFSKYKDVKSLSEAPVSKIAQLIRPSGFYKQKARNIKKICQILMQKYQGRVPKTEVELMALPGVGQKTTDCVLLYGYGKNVVPVDVHVNRVSNRLGWVKTKKPEETKVELEKIIKGEARRTINCLFVRHGQVICQPRRPRCGVCPVAKYCAYYKKIAFSKPL